MLGLGWTEMLVIGVVALIFIGPKDLPVVMNRIGKVIGQVKRMGNEFQREINKTTGLDEVRNLRNSITAPLKKTTDEIRKEFNAMTPTGPKPSGAIKPANPAAESVVDEIKAKAGMTEPAAPLSADEAAKAAGFKPAGPAPTSSSATFGKPSKAAVVKKRAPAKAKAAPTRPVVTTDLAAVDAPAPAAAASEAKAPATKRQASNKSTSANKTPTAEKVTPRKPAAPKSAVVTPAKAGASDTAAAAKAAPKRRAPANPKPATTNTTADKAGDE